MKLKGKTALVTGASSGIGEALARRLAALGAELIVVARRGERLEALGRELSARHGIRVRSLALDLATPVAAARLHGMTEGQGQRVDLLMNNAGFGSRGNFLEIPWEVTAEQLQLNVVTLTELTWRFARSMRERGEGWILNVSSIGAYTPAPLYATYAAGKSYVRNFSEAIAYELRGTGVHVTSVCPGGTLTGFHEVANQEVSPLVRRTFMSADRCAAIALDALFAGKRNLLAGLLNKLSGGLAELLPRALMLPISAALAGAPRARLASGGNTPHPPASGEEGSGQ